MAKQQIPYTEGELFARGPQPARTGRHLDEIAFPLGGIGAGMISLGGWGQLRDWEIMNRPAKGFVAENSFFTLKVKSGSKPAVTRVLQGPAGGDHVGHGHSAPRATAAGLPHFRKVSFTGEFPFATVRFRDPSVPLSVRLTAFNPFIPLNAKDSSIPVAILLYELRNTGNRPADVSLLGNLPNIIGDGPGGRVNKVRKGSGLTGLYLTSTQFPATSPKFGTMALSTTWPDVAVWPRWYGGGHGRVNLLKFWQAVAESDTFPPKRKGDLDVGTVAAHARLKPGQSATIPFFITWHFPTVEHWQQRGTWRNYYATVWADAWDVARYTARHFDRLHDETQRFHDALFSSTLPTHVLDAVSSQISILKTPTCLRLEDGTFYGFEGCNDTSGCCEGSCTHVWNYAQALPFLFPSLQRSMREASFKHALNEEGAVRFRMPLPLGTCPPAAWYPAADGQMGTIIQVYREWLISGDADWLRRVWPQVKAALEFAWKYWDADKDGVIEGVQHNTYDIEFFGPNTLMGSLYLGALRSGEKMARALGEKEKAAEYAALFRMGSAWTDKRLFNGHYYEQKVAPRAFETWPDHYGAVAKKGEKDDRFPWPRWQYGKGCLSDQLLGQWYGAMLGLGHFYKPAHVRKTLQSIFAYNWRPDLSQHPGFFRLYALNHEAGLLVCSWPKGRRPGHAFYFADEVWCGIEYQVASHLIYEGMVEEGLAIVKGVRDRHTGDQRNPWDEFECGHHYSRSMSSYALLTALSGFTYSAPEQRIGFAPKLFQKDFGCFFSVGSGWGTYAQKLGARKAELSVQVRYGSLTVRELRCAAAEQKPTDVTARLGRAIIKAQPVRKGKSLLIRFGSPVRIGEGQRLKVVLSH